MPSELVSQQTYLLVQQERPRDTGAAFTTEVATFFPSRHFMLHLVNRWSQPDSWHDTWRTSIGMLSKTVNDQTQQNHLSGSSLPSMDSINSFTIAAFNNYALVTWPSRKTILTCSFSFLSSQRASRLGHLMQICTHGVCLPRIANVFPISEIRKLERKSNFKGKRQLTQAIICGTDRTSVTYAYNIPQLSQVIICGTDPIRIWQFYYTYTIVRMWNYNVCLFYSFNPYKLYLRVGRT